METANKTYFELAKRVSGITVLVDATSLSSAMAARQDNIDELTHLSSAGILCLSIANTALPRCPSHGTGRRHRCFPRGLRGCRKDVRCACMHSLSWPFLSTNSILTCNSCLCRPLRLTRFRYRPERHERQHQGEACSFAWSTRAILGQTHRADNLIPHLLTCLMMSLDPIVHLNLKTMNNAYGRAHPTLSSENKR